MKIIENKDGVRAAASLILGNLNNDLSIKDLSHLLVMNHHLFQGKSTENLLLFR